MNTRSSNAKLKSLKNAIQGLCTCMFQEIETQELGDEQIVAIYMKMVTYKKQLREINDELLESSSDFATDFVQAEAFDRKCLEACEKLHAKIPETHPLKLGTQVNHLQQSPPAGGGGDADKTTNQASSDKNFLKKPKLEEFDGKNATWPLWKSVFEKSVHENGQWSSDAKFFYLVSSLRKGSFAHKLVMNYVGIENGYNLAWKDLTKHYEARCNVLSIHLRGLRDLHRKFKVEESHNFWQLENLHQAAWGHVNALKAQGTASATYESLALLGVEESLPRDLRAKYFSTHEPTEDSHLGLEMILRFIEKEAQSQRRSWELDPEYAKGEHKKKEGLKQGITRYRKDGWKGKEKHQQNKKHSSMVLTEETPIENLN